MILYFSGTGNSACAARYIGEKIGDDVLDLFEKIRGIDHSAVESERPWVVAAPVYCWQLPHIVKEWLMSTELNGSREIYFILTCGSSMGNAEKYLKRLCRGKGMVYKGCVEIVMPENYIALFEAPEKDEAERIIRAAERPLQKAAECIRKGETFPEAKAGFAGKLLSGITNKMYYPLIVKDKKFYAKDACNGCGLCEKKCPLSNISMDDGKPSWHGTCTHCMACIAYCPQVAIEYGKASRGKVRYVCPR